MVKDWGKTVAHNQEPTAPILGVCNGIFTDQAIFRRVLKYGLACTSANPHSHVD